MSYAVVEMYHCILKSQNFAAAEQSMMHARIFFKMAINSGTPVNLFVDIRQPYETDYESAPIEVGPPIKHNGELVAFSGPYNHTIFKGQFNHEDFSEIVDKYYRNTVGKNASGIRIENSKNIRMKNIGFSRNEIYVIKVNPLGSGPW